MIRLVSMVTPTEVTEKIGLFTPELPKDIGNWFSWAS